MTTPQSPDLEAIKSKWLNECGACDYGVGFYPCTHPSEDYRPVMLNLVQEVERLREDEALVAQAFEEYRASWDRSRDALEAEVAKLRDHILDIDAHATPYGDLPDDPGFVGVYLLTAGALHRALGRIGHSAPSCQAEAERDAALADVLRLTYERDQRIAGAERLGAKANELVQTAAFHRDRANEAARLSAAARDDADDLRKTIAKLEEKVEDREGQLTDRDAWAVRVCTENNLYELPLNVEDEFGGIAAAFKVYRTDLDSAAHFGDVAVAGREEALREVERLRLDMDKVAAAAEEACAQLGYFSSAEARTAHRLLNVVASSLRLSLAAATPPTSPVPAPLTSPSDPPGTRVTGVEYGPPDSNVAAQGWAAMACRTCGQNVVVAFTRRGDWVELNPEPTDTGTARLVSQDPWSPIVQFGATDGVRYDVHQCAAGEP